MDRIKLCRAVLFVLILCSMGVKAIASDCHCALITETQVTALLSQWNQSLQTKDPQKVIENYASDAVLLPTFSNAVLKTPAMIKAYFADILNQNPSITVDEQIIHLGCNWASNAGVYTFHVSKDGQSDTVKARYSFLYRNVNGKWLIIQHHSSAFNP